MMKIGTAYFVTSVIVLLFLSGCSSMEKSLKEFQVRRDVENNMFSSSFPSLRIKVSDSLAYLGSVQADKEERGPATSAGDSTESNFDAATYLFAQSGPDNSLTRGIIIRVMVAAGDPNQEAQKNFLREIQPLSTLESGKVKILEEEYRYDLYLDQNVFTKEEKDLLLKKADIPSCFLVKQLAKKEGFGGKARALIYYFEDVSLTCAGLACGECLDIGKPSPGQQRLLDDFTERSFRAVRFLNPEGPVDVTSRYADPAAGEQVSGKDQKGIGVSKADSIEKRLDTLKDIYGKGLITKEEYEKKKAEILQDL